MPDGASLEATDEGGARVVKDGDTVLVVVPPTAIDAAGKAVPVDLGVEGGSFTLTVEPGPEVSYPILVDPELESWYWELNHNTEGITDWHPSAAPPFEASPVGRYNEAGLNLYSDRGATSTSSSAGSWSYFVPRFFTDQTNFGGSLPTSYIRWMRLRKLDWWVEAEPAVHPYFGVGLYSFTSPAHYVKYNNYFGTADLHDGEAPYFEENQGADVGAKQAVVLVESDDGVSRPRHLQVGEAEVLIDDNDRPVFSNVAGPTQWVNNVATSPITYAVEDPGLGIYGLTFRQPGQNTASYSIGCFGNWGHPCPRAVGQGDRTLAYVPSTMPTGEDKVYLRAQDPLGHYSAEVPATVKVDHASPTLTVSGTATEQAKYGTGLPTYSVKLHVTDGGTAEGTRQSGAARTLIEVDGKAVDPYAPGCTTYSCVIDHEWKLEASRYTTRKHTIKVTAWDAVENRTEKEFTIELGPEPNQTAPVAAYSFDEGSGTVAHDATGNGHDGTFSTLGVSWAPGRYGSALKFDGFKGCVTVPDAPALRPRDQFTLEAWVRPEGELSHLSAVNKVAEGTPGLLAYALGVGLGEAGKPEGRIGTESKGHLDVRSEASIPANTWTHETLVFDGANLYLYVNGVKVKTASVEMAKSGALGPLQIGCGAGEPFRGRVDEVRLYDRALEPSEVEADRGAPVQTPRRGPVAAWSFDEGSGATAEDATGNGHAATLEGATWARGRYGGGLQFDGKSGCVKVGGTPDLDFREEFTVEAWMRPNPSTHAGLPAVTMLDVGSHGEEALFSYELIGGVDPKAWLRNGGETGFRGAYAGRAMPTRAWSHLAVTDDGAQVRLYLNGEQIATVAAPKLTSAEGPLEIGCNDAFGEYFDGRIDEVRLYDRALEGPEIAGDMEAPVQTPKATPVAAYSFDEGSGSVLHDVTGDGHEGTIEAPAAWTKGRTGGALRFGGNEGGCVTIPDSPALRFAEEFTVEAWARSKYLGNEPILFEEDGSTGAYALGIGLVEFGKAETTVDDEGGKRNVLASPNSVAHDTWTHLAASYDGSTLRLFVEGREVAKTAVSGLTLAGGGRPLRIGCAPPLGDTFEGKIDDVRIYDRALGRSEVEADRATPVQSRKAGPVAAFAFDEGSGTTAKDVTGEGHTATLQGATWAPGRYGGGLEFKPASHSVLKIPASPEFALAEGFTLEAWVRPRISTDINAPIVGRTTGGGGGANTFPYYLYAGDSESKPFGQIEDGAGVKRRTAVAPAALPGAAWSHLALTYDGSVERLYVNGAKVSEVASEAPVNSAGELQIGAETEHNQYFDGQIDEVRVYDRPLEGSEVEADREAPVQTPKALPVAAYDLDEGEGTVAHDATGDGHEGAFSAEGVSWRPGRHGDALFFDGSKGCVTIPDSSALQLREAFTLEAWVRPEGALSHLPAITKQVEGTTPFPAYALGVGMGTAEKAEGRIGTEAKGHLDVKSEASVAAGAWTHEALVFDGAALYLYVNGVKVATKAVEKGNAGAAGPLKIGCAAGEYFRGRIDDVRVYNRALEPAEVAADKEAAVTGYAAAAPAGPQKPVASYALDETAGTTAADSTNNGHTGTLSGGAEFSPSGGRFYGALHFDGVDDCVTVPDSEALQFKSEFTLEAWVRPEGEPSYYPAIWKAGEGPPAYALGLGDLETRKPDGQVGTPSKGQAPIVSPTAVEPNVWSHEALTFDGSRLRLYVNGDPVASEPVTGANPGFKGGALQIGCGGGHYFRGRIDEVRIYDRALATGEVQTDRDTAVQAPKGDPIASWPLDEAEGATVATDSSNDGNNDHDGTLSGGVKFSPSGGRFYGALQFDGTNGCVTIPNSAVLQMKEEFTLEAWVRPEGEAVNYPILWKAGEGPPAYSLGVGDLEMRKPDGQVGTVGKGSTQVASPTAVEPEVWSHEALTYDGQRLRLWVNGELVATKQVTGSATESTGGALTIGCGGGHYFKGRIDEVRIYDRVLSGGEVGSDRDTGLQAPKGEPIASYPLDEADPGATTAADSTENGHEGTLSGGVSFTPSGGRFYGALQFAGTDGCVTIPDSGVLQLKEEFTLEAWVRPEGEPSAYPAIWKAGEGPPAYALGIGDLEARKPDGQVGTSGKGQSSIASPAAVEPNVWSHEALTYDGSRLRLYVNGDLEATKAVTGTVVSPEGTALTIGCGGGHYFHGRIDEVRIYDRALATGEIQTDRDTGVSAPKGEPVASYALDEAASATTAVDSSGNKHEGTLSGGVTFTPSGGRFSGALQFNGTSGCVTIPDDTTLQLGEEFTLEAWVRPEGEPSAYPAIWKAGEGPPAYALGVGDLETRKPDGQVGTTGKGLTSIASLWAIEPEVWSHEALTFDGQRLRLYVNGALLATKAVSGANPGFKGGALTIGCGGGHYFKGRIDEVRIYDRILAAGEVVADSLSPLRFTLEPPVASYPLDEAEGTTARDVTGNGHDGTISGQGVTWTGSGGRYGGALQFAGTNGCVTIPDSETLQLKEEFTLEAWVRPEGEALNYPVIWKAGEGPPAYALGVGDQETRKPEGQVGTVGKASTQIASPAAIEPEVWSHEALTYDGSRLRLYVNGQLVATKLVTGANPGVKGGALTIGCGGGHYFRGRIDEVRIYDQALESGEIGTSMLASPSVVTEPVPTSAEGRANEAILYGWVSPNGENTDYFFEYGPTLAYGGEILINEEFEESADEGRIEVSEAVVDLKPETTYHYRLVAVSPAGVSRGVDQTLKTGARTMSVAEEQELLMADEAGTVLPPETQARSTARAAQGGSEAGTPSKFSHVAPDFWGMMWSGNYTQTTEDLSAITSSGVGQYRVVLNQPVSSTIENDNKHDLEVEKAEEAKAKGENPQPVKQPYEADAKSADPATQNIAVLASHGLTVLPYIGAGAIPTQTEWPQWILAAEELVRHYGPGGSFAHPIQTWEIWNEPNMPFPNAEHGEKMVNPKLFGEFFTKMSAAMRKANRKKSEPLTILAPGLFGYKTNVGCKGNLPKLTPAKLEQPNLPNCHETPGSFLTAMGHTDSYNAISLHPYNFKVNKQHLSASSLHSVQALVHKQVFQALEGRVGTPVWITELGFPVAYYPHGGHRSEYLRFPPVDFQLQAELLRSALVTLRVHRFELNIKHAFVYNIADFHRKKSESTGSHKDEEGWESGCGLLTRTGGRRPSYRALSQLVAE